MTAGFTTHTQKPKKQQSCLVEADFRHALAVGETGCGKTTGFILPNLQERIKRGHGILFFDYKGKEHQAVKALAKKHGVLTSVHEMGKPWGLRINLLEMLSKKEFARLFTAQESQTDPFWAQSAKAIALAMLQALRAAQKLKAASESCPTAREHIAHIGEPSFANMAKWTSNMTTFQRFLAELGSLENELLNFLGRGTEKPDLKTQGHKLMPLVDLREAGKCLDAYRDRRLSTVDNPGSGYGGVLMSLNATLTQYAQDDLINEPKGADLFGLLEKGKIVVIDTYNFHETALRPLFRALVSYFSRRAGQGNRSAPVSVFADEAQRLFDPETDLGQDVLREGRVELILSTQNIGQLVEAMGEKKTASLLTNLTHKFFFRGQPVAAAGYNHLMVEDLETFEYVTPIQKPVVAVAKPLFIQEKTRRLGEWAWQQQVPALVDLAEGRSLLFEHDPELFEESGALKAWELNAEKNQMQRDPICVPATMQFAGTARTQQLRAILAEIAHMQTTKEPYYKLRRNYRAWPEPTQQPPSDNA